MTEYEISEDKFRMIKRNNYMFFYLFITILSLLFTAEVYYIIGVASIVRFGFVKIEIIIFLFMFSLGHLIMKLRLNNIKKMTLRMDDDNLFIGYTKGFGTTVKICDIESVKKVTGKNGDIKRIRIRTPYSKADILHFAGLDMIFSELQKSCGENSAVKDKETADKTESLRSTRWNTKGTILSIVIFFAFMVLKIYSIKDNYPRDILFSLFELTARYLIYLIAAVLIVSNFFKVKIFSGFKYKSLLIPAVYIVTVIVLSVNYLPVVIKVLSL